MRTTTAGHAARGVGEPALPGREHDMRPWLGRERCRAVLHLGFALVGLSVLAADPGSALASAAPAPGDRYLEGYAAAVLEREFGKPAATVRVSDGVIFVRAEDLAGVDRERVLAALSSIRGVVAAQVVAEPSAPTAPSPDVARPAPAPELPAGAELARPDRLATGFLKAGRLFDPLIADPRWPHFGASYQRYIDGTGFRDVGAASFGESFSLYRGDVPFGGQWEVGLQAAVFAIFDLDGDSFDLINADYFAALTGSYRVGDWQVLTRLFHQSSHLGDEFLLSNRVDRLNLSYEGFGAIGSRYVFDDAVRLYGGGSVLLRRDPEDLDRGAIQYGLELYSPWRLAPAIRPVAAIDLQNRQQNSWQLDLSARAGLQFESVQVLGRKLQLMLEYFDGHSPNGQFYRERIDYIGVGLHLY
jgi:hypothetical protein